MQAVNAAVCPEVDKHKFALKVLIKRDGVGVEPSVVGRKIWHSQHLSIGVGDSFLGLNELRDHFEILLSENVLAVLVLLELGNQLTRRVG